MYHLIFINFSTSYHLLFSSATALTMKSVKISFEFEWIKRNIPGQLILFLHIAEIS